MVNFSPKNLIKTCGWDPAKDLRTKVWYQNVLEDKSVLFFSLKKLVCSVQLVFYIQTLLLKQIMENSFYWWTRVQQLWFLFFCLHNYGYGNYGFNFWYHKCYCDYQCVSILNTLQYTLPSTFSHIVAQLAPQVLAYFIN